ncbi:3-oxoacyl-[acyl-carrier-protein] synthase, KASI (EC [uncultured Gammaproteobacteria bacterium]|jgi:3-oxoacyl-[acyl-carrier-protein] synthase-1|nr:3-oxoacyl-[acyl-carrier-protein] synthase, KASI (EC 2.3.1.41) [uncultured Gammaproteobacteria bacterium]CAC9451604.1 3-oxoacyl-[acyl-carrier-protein] synthase, KASI (EC 2.3.1.41) [uncultured Gammaproteobacteria bacterium]CAC9463032.1 3-oxoacyl-[acyl-carrier-protein] synthase, KASI (EC 2.3.1.41) [uncultured Gammaproteobacteria bacterium]VVH65501.1 3-oxoacyl-[acyl-carrier-protein] synthase, KASI (EC [uncultured Gammaproteobacteria bacterium]
MNRVVVTGMGIVSSLGTNCAEVLSSLKTTKSGIKFDEIQAAMGLRSHVSGAIAEIDSDEIIDRKMKRFMADAAIYNAVALDEAIKQSGLTDAQVSNPRTGLIMGSGGASNQNVVEAADILREKSIKRVGPYRVPRTMGSTTSACLSTLFKIKGINYSISSACSTSAHCIGNAMEQIQLGKQDVVFAGGGEELNWSLTMLFDAMGALSSKYNENPTQASRAFDVDRDGFVISGGGGALVLESLEHAQTRGATILAELTGYGATSDGHDMVAPSGEGAKRCMELAISTVDGPIDYINAHGTSTPVGDAKELGAIKAVFGDNIPNIGSTKSLSGHALGAAGVNESIYSLLMLQNDFMAESVNINTLDEAAAGMPIVQTTTKQTLNRVMSNSFGFGGTNACLVFEKFKK